MREDEPGPGWQRWVSSRHRASRDPATGDWKIETWRLHERSNSGPITVRAYVGDLPERVDAHSLEMMAGSPGSDMAAFELEDEEQVHVFAMRCFTLPGHLDIVAMPLTPRADREAMREAFSLYREIMGGPRFSWDSPAYRTACRNLGFDPDERRPEYRREDMALVKVLTDWILDPARASDYQQVAVGYVLELIRTDQNASWQVREQVRTNLPIYRRLNVPYLAEIERRTRAA